MSPVPPFLLRDKQRQKYNTLLNKDRSQVPEEYKSPNVTPSA